MNNNAILNNVIDEINSHRTYKNIVLIPKNYSKKFISSILSRNVENAYIIYYIDEYIFHLNNNNSFKLYNSDIKYLSKAIFEINPYLDKNNQLHNVENIMSILLSFFLEKNLFVKSELTANQKLQEIERDMKLLSYESKIFYEICKLWIQKSINDDTYINLYLNFLNQDINQENNNFYHFINNNSLSEIELSWVNKNLKKLIKYDSFFNDDIYNHNYKPLFLKKYKSYDFDSQEEELDFISNDIESVINNNKNSKIALINNNRYFGRRLRAILEEKNIIVNDSYGWLLSTSACCSYINSLLKFMLSEDNFLNIHDIIMSPFFMPKDKIETKKKYLDNIVLNNNQDINRSLEDIMKNNKEKYSLLLKRNFRKNILYKSSEFRHFIISKLEILESLELIKSDEAGKKFLVSLENFTETTSEKYSMKEWHKKLINYLNDLTFVIENSSNIFYIDIKHANLCSFDKIYVSSMSNTHYPRKILNNYSKNNVIYNELSISSNIESDESIRDFLNLSKITDSILLTFHSSDYDEIFSKSKFKNYIDFFIESSNKTLKKENNHNISTKNKNREVKIFLDNDFKNLTYIDIENFNNCFYCFYSGKKSPKRKLSIIENNYFTFGLFVHHILAEVINKYIKEKNITFFDELNKYSHSAKQLFYPNNNASLDFELWIKILPHISNYLTADIDKKYNFSTEKRIYSSYKNFINLQGRSDLQYKLGDKNYVVDYKTGAIPSKKSVLNGISLQLPFYSYINQNFTNAEYIGINISNNTIKKLSFDVSDFDYSKNIITESLDKIFLNIQNNVPLIVKKSSQGCLNCGYKNISL